MKNVNVKAAEVNLWMPECFMSIIFGGSRPDCLAVVAGFGSGVI